ncbi:ATP-binding protein [Ruminococcus flavefaciens]|uniref:ATP-binding protein n=1 Tax=Ruminococcus flavefaciens TaxID=1265 RepID=UPI0026EE9262|nr:DUF87 domain-containing protein [Ruminococcus flavefaciens]
MSLDNLYDNLENCLSIVDEEVMKGYVKKLHELKIVEPSKVLSDALGQIQFFRIRELVYEQDEFSVHKLASVFHTLSNKPCTLVLMIKSRIDSNEVYLGVRSNSAENSTGTMRMMLEQSLLGHFPGSKVEGYTVDMLEADFNYANAHHLSDSISSVTSVADFKQEKERVSNKEFVQGLEKYIYSIKGKNVTSVFIADNIPYDELMTIKNDYEAIYTQLSPFAEMQYNFATSNTDGNALSYSAGKSDSKTVGEQTSLMENTAVQQSKAMGMNASSSSTYMMGTVFSSSRGASHTAGHSDANSSSVTDGESVAKSKSKTRGKNLGLNLILLNAGVNKSKSKTVTKTQSHSETYGYTHTDNVSDTISETLTHGVNESHSDTNAVGVSETITDALTRTTGSQYGINISLGSTENHSISDSVSKTLGTSTAVTLNAKNRSISSILDRLDKQLERLDECESVGMWNMAAYFIGEVMADTETAANTYYSLMSGNHTGIERSAINTWTEPADVEALKGYLNKFVHPCFEYKGFSYDDDRNVIVKPTSMVSTNELAIHMALPRHSVKGLPVIQHAPFAQEVLSKKGSEGIDIGSIYHLGETTPERVCLDPDSLTMHTFITGSTGAGKSNAVYTILNKLKHNNIKFLVIEPAKGEYKHVFGNEENVFVYGTNPIKTPLLRINPFSFPEDVHVLEHMDRLVGVFNVCWPMYAAMPAVLKNAIESSYRDCGWDLTDSVNLYGKNLYPNFDDVARNIKDIIDNSEYDSENKGAYKGSLLTRLKSLTNGLNGMLFTENELSSMELFDENVIVDLSRIGSNETRSLIMGMLVLKLQEYRMSNSSMNSSLRHVTVLEEAHNLLKRTSTEQSDETSNLIGKSVEMLSNAIAEMRSYGEGFVIADQAPGLLDMSTIRNTNTKIILRLPDENDRELVGKAANLDDAQVIELSKLQCGVAAIYQNEWIQPILCQFDKFKTDDYMYKYTYNAVSDKNNHTEEKIKIADMLSSGVKLGTLEIEENLKPLLKKLGLPASKQVRIIKLLSSPPKKLRMTKYAPIICSLFPNLLDDMKEIYSETNQPSAWTEYIEDSISEMINENIALQTKRDIIQGVVTFYLLNELNDRDTLKKWSEKGELK